MVDTDNPSGGGAFGVSAGVKGGYSQNSSDSNANQKDTQTKVLTITYNVCSKI